jgi:hypothetical protein
LGGDDNFMNKQAIGLNPPFTAKPQTQAGKDAVAPARKEQAARAARAEQREMVAQEAVRKEQQRQWLQLSVQQWQQQSREGGEGGRLSGLKMEKQRKYLGLAPPAASTASGT